jgi:hypothetical protein
MKTLRARDLHDKEFGAFINTVEAPVKDEEEGSSWRLRSGSATGSMPPSEIVWCKV